MNHPGSFFGWRDWEALSAGGRRGEMVADRIRQRKSPFIPSDRLAVKKFPSEDMPETSYGYQVFSGVAADAFGDVQDFSFQTEYVIMMIWDNPADIEFYYGASVDLVTRYSERGNLRQVAARSFRIRNSNPGMAARYQIIVFN